MNNSLSSQSSSLRQDTAGISRLPVRLYHAGFQVIEKPDIHRGRRNADFGWGFYLTPDEDFAVKWAREQKDRRTFINRYDFDWDGLAVVRLQRDSAWFACLSANRAGAPDPYSGADVIAGPIANDILYDTQGLITSGFLTPQQSLRLLQLGPEYTQIALKTEKAASHLRFVDALEVDSARLAASRKLVLREEQVYQQLFAEELAKMLEEE
ncbi:MAG: DUF3990 domain-containing protein [Clostridia bacterium]|nr:DUF3990 domain-containing protein [Clostridia bacterium]